MLNNRSNNVEKLNEFIITKKEKGLRLLILFKTIKAKVISELEKENEPEIVKNSMQSIDSVCIELAKQILNSGGEQPTEKDIHNIMENLAKSWPNRTLNSE